MTWLELHAGRYDAQGASGISVTNVAPMLTVKAGARRVDGVFTSVPSFRVQEAGAGRADYVVANGVAFDCAHATSTDLDAGDYPVRQGRNEITVYDTIGNQATFEFEIDTLAPEVVKVDQWDEAKEGGRTVVRLTFSERIDESSLGEGWFGGGRTFTKRFYRAGDLALTFRDLVGHPGTAVIAVQAPVPVADDAAGSDAAVLRAAVVGTTAAHALAAA